MNQTNCQKQQELYKQLEKYVRLCLQDHKIYKGLSDTIEELDNLFQKEANHEVVDD